MENLTEVVVRDNANEAITSNKLMTYSISLSMAAVTLVGGSILSFTQPEKYSLLWTFVTTAATIGFAYISAYYYSATIKVNVNNDVNYLQKLLTP